MFGRLGADETTIPTPWGALLVVGVLAVGLIAVSTSSSPMRANRKRRARRFRANGRRLSTPLEPEDVYRGAHVRVRGKKGKNGRRPFLPALVQGVRNYNGFQWVMIEVSDPAFLGGRVHSTEVPIEQVFPHAKRHAISPLRARKR